MEFFFLDFEGHSNRLERRFLKMCMDNKKSGHKKNIQNIFFRVCEQCVFLKYSVLYMLIASLLDFQHIY